MEENFSFCEYVLTREPADISRKYHDNVYGFPLKEDNALFERLVLEINQAGLSWITILKKEDNFRKAYHDFDINKVASYKEKDIKRLLNDSGIIRNRLKINAAITNAQRIKDLQKEYGSFKNWLDQNCPKTKEEWVLLFKKNFTFTGKEITNEFVLSTGYLKGAHEEDCIIYQKILKKKPTWSIKKSNSK